LRSEAGRHERAGGGQVVFDVAECCYFLKDGGQEAADAPCMAEKTQNRKYSIFNIQSSI